MSQTHHDITPPKAAEKLLRLIYDDELLEDILGDLQEMFQDRVESKGLFKARLHYFKDAFLSIRNYDLRRKRKVNHNNSIPMLKNYIKTTFRTLAKNRVYSALNIFGLALGIAACLFISQYVSYEYSYDRFHSNHENLYRVKYMVYRGENLQINCAAAVPRVGPFMKENMPEVVDFARAFPISGVFERDNIQFREKRVHIVDPSFLKMFDYPLIHGDMETALTEPNTVVITESIANKYFGRTDVVGETLNLYTWIEETLEITGVTMDVPENSHLKYNFLISYETLNNETRNDDGTASSETAWGWYDFNTYVLLEDGADPKVFDEKFEEVLYAERGEDFEKYNFRSDFPLQPITDIHLHSNLLQESEPTEQGDGDTVFFLAIIAAFILIIAWINYINLSTAKSLERAKEVGVRKSMGAHKRQLVNQFLTESFVLNFLALSLAVIVVVITTPFFNQLIDADLSRAFFLEPKFWLAVLGVYVLGSFLSGLYPAFILSSFRPIQVLKGKMTTNKSGILLRRALVVFQFAASVTLIAGTIIVYQQLSHMKKLDVGFDMSDTMVMRGPEVFAVDSLFGNALNAFENEIISNPNIEAVTNSSNVPGDEIFWTRGMRKQEDTRDKSFTVYLVGVDQDYFPTYDIEFLAGRNYDKSFTTDTSNVIINKATMEYLGIQTPDEAIGQRVLIGGSDKRTIIGVVDNYRQQSVKNSINPLVFPLTENSASFISVKLNTDDFQSAYEESKTTFDQFFPGNPFDTFFLDEFYNKQYANEQNFSRAFTLFAFFAIIVACLGLFGLTSFTALQRTKEIGIRKVLGADISQIVMILSKEFLILVGIANVISWPIVYFLMDGWLDNFTSRITIGVSVFLIAAIMVVIIALIAVGNKTFSIAKTNPVKALRYE
ncbi:ABC transporter permease [Ekhidna sp.]|uniref:ABC transporter permease n=1 Tax=Ekhidna sp. TaxID=2608089 RepID=UPI0032976CC8